MALITIAFGPAATLIAGVTMGSLVILFVAVGIAKTFQRGKA